MSPPRPSRGPGLAAPRPCPDLREPGRILLISCYELGHAPHGLALPAAFLERAGFAPVCVDLAVDTLKGRVIERARQIWLSVPMHTALRLGTRAAARIRAQSPDAEIGFFGLYAALNRDYLGELGARWAVAGEVEDTVVAIARAAVADE
ncbi:MAG: hypothetical protein AAGC55_10525, partial [Myxococcota bacterium]